MDIRQLRAFIAVASERNFTRAAAELHTVQSGVSATIQSLEQELGTPLFDRRPRQIETTAAGEALLPEARKVLDAIRAARDAVDATGTRLTGTVALGYMASATQVDIPALLREYSQRHDGVTIRLKVAEHGTTGLVEMLRDGELDLALIVQYTQLPDLETMPVTRSPMHLTVPADHPLAAKTRVTFKRLATERFVDFPEGFGFRELADASFQAAGLQRHVAYEAMDILSVGALVDHGLGISFLPEFISDRLPNTRVVPLDHELPDMVVSVATLKRRPLSAAGRALRSLIVEQHGAPANDPGTPGSQGRTRKRTQRRRRRQ